MNSSPSVELPGLFPSCSTPRPRRSAFAALLSGLLALGAAGTISAAESKSSGALLLVANKGEHTLGIIDPVAGKQIAVIPEEEITGHEVTASSDGKRAFVPIYGNSGVGNPGTDGSLIRVIDLVRGEITATIDLGRGVRPHCPVFGPKNGLLYVTTELAETVTVIDPGTLKVTATIPTGDKESHMLAITNDGRRGYTANVGPGTVSVLDLENQKLITVIKVAPQVQRIAVSLDGRHVFTADQTEPRLAVIDTATNEVASWVKLPATAYGTAPTLDGRWLLVTLPRLNQVAVVDLNSMKMTRTLELPRAPEELLVRPDGAVAYVSCGASRQVGVIDLKTWKVTQLIDAGRGADGLAWAAAN